MELIIKSNWTDYEKEEYIENYVQNLGIKLFLMCKNSKHISMDTSNTVNINLCIVYIRKIVKKHLKNFYSGIIKVELTEKDIINVSSLVKELNIDNDCAI